MTVDMLVVTPIPAVADAIRRNLQETGPYRIHIVNNKAAAVVKADEFACALVVLDLDLGETWVVEIGQALRTINAKVKIVVLCQDEVPPALESIRPWTLLRKPFYVKDLLRTLKNADGESVDVNVIDLPWLQDVTVAAQHLTRITLESSAQAALITRKNELWAYAGGLSQSAGKEVAQTVTRNWDGQKGSDLLRFIRLESTRAEHMLYATRLAPDVVLALVFDAETPFSTIRTQANQLISSIGLEKADPSRPTPATSPASAAPVATPMDEFEEEEGVEVPLITDILKNVPSPNPPLKTIRETDLPAISEEYTYPLGDNHQPVPRPDVGVYSRESSPAVRLGDLLMSPPPPMDETIPSQATLSELDVAAPSKPKQRPETPVAKPKPNELAETRPSPTTEAARRITMEPVTAGLYHLTYACLLVPRFSAHYLTGDVADHLAEWLPSICVAFGWRLEYLAVRPEYLQWVVNVQPNTSPGYLMRVMRQQTSEKIFSDFQRLKKENPSGDFWAPGYLIMGGTQPHPPQLVRDYIKQTRERQGLSQPRK
jgi:REP element-mobilizing transposase RayT/ActR/RegA family two-component response regulator